MADEPKKKSKRRLVKSPETFRERAVKASESEDKKRQPVKKTKSMVATKASPIASRLQTLSKKKPARVIIWPFKIIGLIIFPVYFRNSFKELKLVTWPNWRESRRLTFAVLIFAVIFGASIAGVDWVFDKVFKDFIIK